MTDEIKQTEALTDEESIALFGWGENIFGLAAHQLSWRPKDLHFVLYADGRPVSHAGILRHVVKVNGQPFIVGGLGGVVTVPESQRRGYAARLVRHAANYLANEYEVDAGFLFCLPSMVEYYEALGWQVLKAEVLIEQPRGRIASPMQVMILPFGREPWPNGTVELQSLPW